MKWARNHLHETPRQPRVLIDADAVETLVAGDTWIDPETGVQLLLADTVQAVGLAPVDLDLTDFQLEAFSEDQPNLSAIVRASGGTYGLDVSGGPVDGPGGKGWKATYRFRRIPPPPLFIELDADPGRLIMKAFWNGALAGICGTAGLAGAAYFLADVWGWF